MAGAGIFHDDLYGFVDQVVFNRHFNFNLWQEENVVFQAAINFFMAALASVTFYLGYSHAFNSNIVKCVFYLFQLMRLYYAFEQFHINSDRFLRLILRWFFGAFSTETRRDEATFVRNMPLRRAA